MVELSLHLDIPSRIHILRSRWEVAPILSPYNGRNPVWGRIRFTDVDEGGLSVALWAVVGGRHGSKNLDMLSHVLRRILPADDPFQITRVGRGKFFGGVRDGLYVWHDVIADMNIIDEAFRVVLIVGSFIHIVIEGNLIQFVAGRLPTRSCRVGKFWANDAKKGLACLAGDNVSGVCICAGKPANGVNTCV